MTRLVPAFADTVKPIWFHYSSHVPWRTIPELRNDFLVEQTRTPMQLDAELAYFLGALRDGYVDRKNYLIAISQKNVIWLEHLAHIAAKHFGCKPRIRVFRGKYYELRIYSKEMFLFVEREIPEPNRIPSSIRADRTLWKPYIEGFFDAEGYCTRPETFQKTGKKKISFHQNDKASLEFIRAALQESGISATLYLQKGRQCYALYIQSSDGIRKFSAAFQPLMKKERIDNLVSVLPPERHHSWFLPKCIGVQPRTIKAGRVE
ncbi:hypothetical protein HY629_01410, partial [Candidatus Uhrbacteria bacterium]|nr:hypothetical protein [Candidatus Uhrbacteria bacterium]